MRQFQIIFNPSFPYRLVHMSVAAFLATALMVAASAAWHLLRGNRNEAAGALRAAANESCKRSVENLAAIAELERLGR